MFRAAIAVCTGVLALSACSAERTTHPLYGQDCDAGAGLKEYKGFCVAADASESMQASGVRGAGEGAVPGAGAGAGAGTGASSPPAQAPGAEPNDAASGDVHDAGSAPPEPDACASGAGGAETCNGGDDDCDGRSDEGIDEGCYEGATGCEALAGTYRCSGLCTAGISRCVDGVFGECEGQRTPAATDSCTASGELAADEDCDGAIDEGCPCEDTTQACYSGPAGTRDVASCRAGTQTCSNDGFGECMGEVLPEPETCANPGADDDCNGRTDDVATVGTACTDDAQSGPCATGTRRCSGDALVCETPAPSAEICNGRDDDCDGRSDDGFDLQSNRDHCGACGRACTSAQTCCAGGCVNLASSREHCGACGNDCGAGRACCGAACQDLQNDPAHCGACGRVCASNQSCCNGACVDTAADADHCGACGNDCGSGQSCCSGACYNLDSAADHCGSCTHSCAPLLEGCCRGACRLLSLGC